MEKTNNLCHFSNCKIKANSMVDSRFEEKYCKFHFSTTQATYDCNEMKLATGKHNLKVCLNDHHKKGVSRIFENDDPKRKNCVICSDRKSSTDEKKLQNIASTIKELYEKYPEKVTLGYKICSHKSCEYRTSHSDVEMFMNPTEFISISDPTQTTTQCLNCREKQATYEAAANRPTPKEKEEKYPKIKENKRAKKKTGKEPTVDA